MNKKSTVLIVDDHPLLRRALREVIEEQEGFTVIGESDNGMDAIQKASELEPDIIIMDIDMPQMDGIEATRRIKDKQPKVKILVLTIYNDTEHILGILEAGANGYLPKSIFDEELTNALHRLSSEKMILSENVSKQVIDYVVRRNKDIEKDAHEIPLSYTQKLSNREKEILKLAAEGKSNKDIALNLNLSLRTVKGHFANIFVKLSVKSRTEAVVTGIRDGIIRLNDN